MWHQASRPCRVIADLWCFSGADVTVSFGRWHQIHSTDTGTNRPVIIGLPRAWNIQPSITYTGTFSPVCTTSSWTRPVQDRPFLHAAQRQVLDPFVAYRVCEGIIRGEEAVSAAAARGLLCCRPGRPHCAASQLSHLPPRVSRMPFLSLTSRLCPFARLLLQFGLL